MPTQGRREPPGGPYARRMRVAIGGAGPTGLYAATALARRGHGVTVVDRYPGPAPGGEWQRRSVMQFHHPHGLRRQILTALDAELPWRAPLPSGPSRDELVSLISRVGV